MGEKHLTISGVKAGSRETVLGAGHGTCYNGEISCNCATVSGSGPQRNQTYAGLADRNYDVVCKNPGEKGQGVVFTLKSGQTCDLYRDPATAYNQNPARDRELRPFRAVSVSLSSRPTHALARSCCSVLDFSYVKSTEYAFWSIGAAAHKPSWATSGSHIPQTARHWRLAPRRRDHDRAGTGSVVRTGRRTPHGR
jgi:hypothetical protein